MGSPQNRASNSENHIESEKIHQKSLKLGALRADNLQNHHVPFKTVFPQGYMGVSQNWGYLISPFSGSFKGVQHFQEITPLTALTH